MFGKRVTLFKLAGFAVRVDVSWLFLAVLVTWTLAAGLFPVTEKGLNTTTYWLMGIAAAIFLFASIILHELSHSIVARRFNLPMKGITLFIFGGVAEMDDEPPSARVELATAAAGPISSYILAGMFYLVTLGYSWPAPVRGVLDYLVWINAVLATFNLLPAFPLDGGRILRSLLWAGKKNLRDATRVASRIGGIFAFILIALGIVSFFRGAIIGGIWWVMIGLFLRAASQSSYGQLLMRETLEGEPLTRFMTSDPVTVEPGTTVDRFVEDYVYEYHFKMYPVVDGNRLAGCVTTRDVKEIPRQEWSRRTVGEIAHECNDENSIDANSDAFEAWKKMHRSGASRMAVIDGGRLGGVVALKDLARFLALKLELDEDERTRAVT